MKKSKKIEKEKIDILKIKKWFRSFAKQREWDQYHTPKNLVMAMAGELGELIELFQWLTPEESFGLKKSSPKKLNAADEIADIMVYLIRLSDILEIDLEKAIWNKLKKNAAKYPVHLAKGNAKKYNEF